MYTRHTRKRYPKEFKEEAVALVTEQGYSVSKAAEAVGIRSSLLYTWKDAIESELKGQTLSDEEPTELKRLRQEVRELKLVKEILKKASAFFAKHMK